jgi:hypothetical protein
MKRQLREIADRRSLLIFRAESQRRIAVSYCRALSLGDFILNFAKSAVKTMLKYHSNKGLTIFSSLWAIVHRSK